VEKKKIAAKSDDREYLKAKEKYDAIKQRDRGIGFDIDLELFRKFYGKDADDRQCYYCKIKESQIKKLFASNKIFTRRKNNYYNSMGIDRIDPNKSYAYRGDKKNLALCCFWCNSAKMDEFTEAEFLPIAAAIRKALEGRLG